MAGSARLTGLSLGNFKAFELARADIAPLTFIFGMNSSGKTTLLQGLLALRQTLEHGTPDGPDLVLDGPLVDLGTFENALHHGGDGESTGDIITIGLALVLAPDAEAAHPPEVQVELDFTDPWRPPEGAQGEERPGPHLRQVTLSFTAANVGGISLPLEVRDRVRRGDDEEIELAPAGGEWPESLASWLASLRNGSAGEWQWLRESARPQQAPALPTGEAELTSSAVPAAEAQVTASAVPGTEAVTSAHFEKLLEAWLSARAAPFVLSGRASDGGWLPNRVRPGRGQSEPSSSPPDRARDESGADPESDHQWVADVIEALLREVGEGVRAVVRSTRHIGPYRLPPERVSRLRGPGDDVGVRGEHLVPVLDRLGGQIDDVSDRLKELGIQYDLDIEKFRELFAALLLQSRPGADGASPFTLSVQDVGFGISQVLPILAQLEVARGDESYVVFVEQPELHLHPEAQVALAEQVCRLVQDHPSVSVILETHSEHLVLAALGCVRAYSGARGRDASIGEPVAEIGDADLSHEKVAIVVVGDGEDRPGGAQVQTAAESVTRGPQASNAEVSPDGSVVEGWPPGFFTAGERLLRKLVVRGGPRRHAADGRD